MLWISEDRFSIDLKYLLERFHPGVLDCSLNDLERREVDHDRIPGWCALAKLYVCMKLQAMTIFFDICEEIKARE